jgi:hypothetical protein
MFKPDLHFHFFTVFGIQGRDLVEETAGLVELGFPCPVVMTAYASADRLL